MQSSEEEMHAFWEKWSKQEEKQRAECEKYKQSQRSYDQIKRIKIKGQRQLHGKEHTLSDCWEETRYLGEENRAFKAEMFEKIHRKGMKQLRERKSRRVNI